MATPVPLPEPEELTREAIARWHDDLMRTLFEAVAQLQVGDVGGNGVVVLDDTAPLPEGLLAWTLIARSADAPPPVELEAITATMTSTRGNGSTLSLPVPVDASVDDLLVAIITTGITGGSLTPPAGWVLRQQHLEPASDYRATAIYTYSVTDTVPDGNQDWAISSGRYLGIMLRVTGADLVDPVQANGGASSRATNQITVPDLLGSAGSLVFSFTNLNGTSPNTLIPVALPVNLTKIYENTDVDGTAVSRTALTVAIDYPTVDIDGYTAVADSSVSSGASQMIAIRAAT